MEWALSAVFFVAAVTASIFWRRAEREARTAEAALAGEKARSTAMAEQLETLKGAQEDFKTYAKAAAFETGQQLSSKLLEDHKRERESANKQIEQFTKNATEQLMKEQKQLSGLMSQMQGKMEGSAAQLDVLVRAMKNPIGAGAEAEIAFENRLNQLGLQRGIDYDTQLSVEGGKYRPDAVIYLPEEQVMVLDSKASQHIYGLFEAEGTEAFDAVFEKLVATMKTHIRELTSKDYAGSVEKHLKKQGREVHRIHKVMYVPNDEVILRIAKHHPEIMQQCTQHNLMLVGPTNLPSLFLCVRNVILEARSNDNQREILGLVQTLMTNVITMLGHADKTGRSLKSSMESFDAFAKSLNRNVLSPMRKIAAKGLRPEKGKDVPTAITTYDVDAREPDPIIENESDTPKLLDNNSEAA